jgi:hypothetical protein
MTADGLKTGEAGKLIQQQLFFFLVMLKTSRLLEIDHPQPAEHLHTFTA